jgi:hypothetical protein
MNTENMLLLVFEEDKQSLVSYYLWPDGSKSLHSQIGLSKLVEMGLETASLELGESILASLETTREAMFN